MNDHTGSTVRGVGVDIARTSLREKAPYERASFAVGQLTQVLRHIAGARTVDEARTWARHGLDIAGVLDELGGNGRRLARRDTPKVRLHYEGIRLDGKHAEGDTDVFDSPRHLAEVLFDQDWQELTVWIDGMAVAGIYRNGGVWWDGQPVPVRDNGTWVPDKHGSTS